MPADLPRNRLGLAQWLVRPEHPLTARVTVNRFWQEVFGTGLVRTAGDFGVTGELPSHPELLDWLAVEFRESGWDVKRLFRLMVDLGHLPPVGRDHAGEAREGPAEPAALARAAVPHGRRDDPRLRAGGQRPAGRRRSAGRASSRTSPRGSGRRWPCPRATPATTSRDHGEKLYRRSLYTFWKRSRAAGLDGHLQRPEREVCTVRRERTNTPLQALVTLNDPQFVEAARRLAQSALKDGGADLRRPPRLPRPRGCSPGRSAPRSAQVVAGLARRA